MEANRAKWPRWQLLLVFALAMAVRLVAIKLMPLDPKHDPDGYLYIGKTLYERGCYSGMRILNLGVWGDVPTAYRPPLYPLLVAGCEIAGREAMSLLATAHVLLGAATTAPGVAACSALGMLRGAAAPIAAGLVAIDPILVHQASQAMTETLATFLAALGLLVLTIAGERQSVRLGTDCRRRAELGRVVAASVPRLACARRVRARLGHARLEAALACGRRIRDRRRRGHQPLGRP